MLKRVREETLTDMGRMGEDQRHNHDGENNGHPGRLQETGGKEGGCGQGRGHVP